MIRKAKEIVGLIPAAGQGSRIGPLPCSKEIYPVGFGSFPGKDGLWPKASCQYVMEKMRLGGIRKVFVVLREGKWDIPLFLGDGHNCGIHIAYLMRNLPYGVPFTLDQAYPFLADNMVALGWPDIILQGENEYQQLIDHQKDTHAHVVVGLFPADRPEKVDMVEVDEFGRVKEIVIKPASTNLCFTWGMAIWTPVFSEFLHEFVRMAAQRDAEQSPEIFVGDVIRAALQDGLKVEGVHVSDTPYIDIGTPEDLQRVVRLFQPVN
jgi:glucose-1-phosphate thymidylyltransferase